MKTLHFAILSLALATAAHAKPGWTEDYEKGLKQAEKENKFTLVDFTGSDWCSWCIRLDKEVFSQAKFKEYAKENLVLVEIDFPQLKDVPKDTSEERAALAKKYGVQGLPSVVVLDAKGKKVAQLGYMEGGAEAFIAELEKLKTAAK